jgi:hypothetical protein
MADESLDKWTLTTEGFRLWLETRGNTIPGELRKFLREIPTGENGVALCDEHHHEGAKEQPTSDLHVSLLMRRFQANESRPAHRVFRFIELLSHVVPTRIRRESFEPAYNDEKADYLKSRVQYKSKAARRWLAFCFGLHVALMVVQCLWRMCGDFLEQPLLSLLPDLLRRLLR